MDIKLELDEEKGGAFILYDNEIKIGEMAVRISDNFITIYHTKVIPDHEGKGNAKKLIHAMIQYADENYLMIVPLCSYTIAQFLAHPDQYDSIWKQNINGY